MMTLGEAVGFGVPALAGAVAYGAGLPDAAAVPLAVAAGAAEGAILGFAQSLVLRREVVAFATRAWTAATAAAAALGWAVGMPLGLYGATLPIAVLVVASIVGGVVVVASVGVAQWLVLRRHVAHAGLWMPANALGWILGMSVPFLGMSLVDEGDPAVLVLVAGIASGLAMGFVVAAVTGVAVVRLLRPASVRRPRPMRIVNRFVNPVVRALLRSPAHSFLSSSVVLLTYTGRRTGRTHSLPVMYAQTDDTLLVCAAQPERKRWWRNLSRATPVKVRLRGRVRHGQGRLITDRDEIVTALRLYLARFPRAARSLGVSLDAEKRRTQSTFRRAAASAVVVAIELVAETTGTKSGRLPAVVRLSRAVHGLISVVFLSCIALVYLGAWRGTAGAVTLAAVTALCLEGLLVLLSRGNCPLGPLFRRLGDEKPFFELLLPPRAAKLAVPALAVISILGFVLLAIRTLWI